MYSIKLWLIGTCRVELKHQGDVSAFIGKILQTILMYFSIMIVKPFTHIMKLSLTSLTRSKQEFLCNSHYKICSSIKKASNLCASACIFSESCFCYWMNWLKALLGRGLFCVTIEIRVGKTLTESMKSDSSAETPDIEFHPNGLLIT